MTRSRRRDTSVPRRPARPSGDRRGGILERIGGLPPWLQAVAALIPAILAVLVFLGLDPPGSTSTDRLSMDQPVMGSSGLEVSGTYSGLDPDSETIVVLLVLDDPEAEARFTPVEADLTPASSAAGDGGEAGEDGSWRVEIPVARTGAYLVEADIIRARRGAGFSSEVAAELRENGPEASVVVEGTDPVRVEP
jgi:hypothetical protein